MIERKSSYLFPVVSQDLHHLKDLKKTRNINLQTVVYKSKLLDLMKKNLKRKRNYDLMTKTCDVLFEILVEALLVRVAEFFI